MYISSFESLHLPGFSPSHHFLGVTIFILGMIVAVLILLVVPPNLLCFFGFCCTPPHCLLFTPFRQTAVQNWSRLPTCCMKGSEEEMWLRSSLFRGVPTRALPFAQAVPLAPAVLGRTAVSRDQSSQRKEEPGNPQCEKANTLYYFSLRNASYVLCFFFFFIFYLEQRRISRPN